MDVDVLFRRLRVARFAALPLPSMTAKDDGLLWYRTAPGRIDTLAAWDLGYAAGLLVPPVRNWDRPFEPSTALFQHVGTLEDVVDAVLEFE